MDWLDGPLREWLEGPDGPGIDFYFSGSLEAGEGEVKLVGYLQVSPTPKASPAHPRLAPFPVLLNLYLSQRPASSKQLTLV